MLTLTQTEQFYESLDPALEGPEDICGHAFAEALAAAVEADGGEPDPAWKTITSSIPGGGRVLKTIRGMGTIYDWRHTTWSKPSGGIITPRLGVQHIPVIRNVDGYGDLITLRNVLVGQGLMVAHGTDREGNAALYAPGNRLCWHARGANQVSWGTENMHLTVTEPWTLRQLRASAWINQLMKRKYGTGVLRGALMPGDGVVRITRGGQTTHERVSACAGYFDRTDPGAGYDFEYVEHAVRFFGEHGHFEGA